jgi:outer membrane receptor protein involved in Fe transport
VPVLRKQIALETDGGTLREALNEITRQTGLAFVYSRDVVNADSRVHLRATQITVTAALTEILLDAGVDVLLSSSRQAALVKRQYPVQHGSISGRVTDAKTSSAIVGATVAIERTSLSASTDNDGRYRIAEVVPGNYTVRARYIGYAPASMPVTIGADQEATADFALERSVQKLDEVVTTGTVVPTEVRALPTPVTVVGESDIAAQHPHTVQELFRQVVPGAVSWDQVNNPYLTAFSVRGASTMANQVGQMKVFIDGIEAASTSVAPVDPSSIERIEVIRGPQAASIYGSDAIGGVIQILTKRGDPNLVRPQLSAEAALGVLQTPYADFGGVLRQTYAASLRGGGPDANYNLGAGYSHSDNYLPGGENSVQSNPSVYGGMRFARGVLSIDVSGRSYLQNVPAVLNPELAGTGFVFFSKPFHEDQQTKNQGLGARLDVAATSWWQHTIVAGLDHYSLEFEYTQPRLTTPDDTLLAVFNQSRTKMSLGYNTSVQGILGRGLYGSLTAGVDHYSVPINQFFTFGALNTTGSIQTVPDQPVSASRTITNNTGYFAQAQLSIRDALYLTGGLRAEENSGFGDSLGTPVSPRIGASYVQQLAGVTLKLRSSWGRAIRPPAPGYKLASVGTTQIQLANPTLGPERQQGWDAGADAVFGARGSLSVTYYDQTADDLIEFVSLPTPQPAIQAQNVGRVANTGLEVEGTLALGPMTMKASYGYSRARIEQLAPNYTGDLLVGDQTLATPKHSAGALVTVTPLAGTSISAGLTYVGSWNQYDYVAEFRCFGGTGPCQPTFRDYIVEYPSFVRVNATIAQQITPMLSGFISLDNLTNNTSFELDNLSPVVGRITTAGIRFHH